MAELTSFSRSIVPLSKAVAKCLYAREIGNGNAERFLSSCRYANINRRLFLTRSGRLGSSPQYCTLVGDAYVEGIMDGEYIQGLKAAETYETETQWFEIH